MKQEKKTYEQVFAELEELVAKIEDPERELSEIGKDVKKASEMIAWCRDYIRGQEEEIGKLMKNQ